VGVFKTERRIWTEVTDLRPASERLTAHFQAKGYEVLPQQTATGAWDIDITRAGVFRTVSGMRSALKVRLEPNPGSVMARAEIGVFGQQALPTVVSMVVFWPILVTQVWGIVQAAKLDDEALRVVEEALTGVPATPPGAPPPAAPAAPAAPAPLAPAAPPVAPAPLAPAAAPVGVFCGECGTPASGGKFCTGCGTRLPVA
jgi:hypothetical protein